MKRKIYILVMAGLISMSVMLTSCGNKNQAEDVGSQKEALEQEEDKESDQDDVQGTVSQTEDEKKPEEDETEEPETDDEDANPESEKKTLELIRGVIENGMYTNSSIKLSFPVSDDMMVFTDEQIAQAAGISMDAMSETGVVTPEQMELATEGTVYDAMILFPDMESNLIICCENMDITGNGLRFSAEQYSKIVDVQSKQLYDDYEVIDSQTVELGGLEYIRKEISFQGQKQVFLIRQVENYMVAMILTVSSEGEQLADDFMNSIVAVE